MWLCLCADLLPLSSCPSRLPSSLLPPPYHLSPPPSAQLILQSLDPKFQLAQPLRRVRLGPLCPRAPSWRSCRKRFRVNSETLTSGRTGGSSSTRRDKGSTLCVGQDISLSEGAGTASCPSCACACRCDGACQCSNPATCVLEAARMPACSRHSAPHTPSKSTGQQRTRCTLRAGG